MITLDGSQGEGGGQIVRSALALSMCTAKPFRIEHIRARRRRPGLQRQHLAAVQAAAQICSATLSGAGPGSQSLQFTPGAIRPGRYSFDIGTAGSATLVLQTVLPALLTAPGSSQLVIDGGTHNPLAPSYEFLEQTFLPALSLMGATVRTRLVRHGFYPAGGGRIEIGVVGCGRLAPLHLLSRGESCTPQAHALVARLPLSIAMRELEVVRRELGWGQQQLHAIEVKESRGPGNVLNLFLTCAALTEVISVCGRRGVRAEDVAQEAVDQARQYLQADVPVGRHLADQLIVPMALAGGGQFITMQPDPHTVTNIAVVERFVDVRFTTRAENGRWRISCTGA